VSRVKLGIEGRVYRPRYLLTVYANGNPAKKRKTVDLATVTSIQTSKNITDVAGTFTITLKDPRALDRKNGIREMDVIDIRLGRDGGVDPVLRGVVDTVTQGGSAGANSAEQSVTITGRCVGKYLQVTSMFLPVWDANSLLPTTLTFGIGYSGGDVPSPHPDVGASPRAIFGYLLRRYGFGKRKVVGAGIPNARYWIDYRSRMGSLNKFQVPFVQFNEDTLANALKTFEIPGFAEAWVDELGRVVYRRPKYDAQADFSLWTGDLLSWSFSESDEAIATYVEVIPSGDPGLAVSVTQALLAGRAPVPSNYINNVQEGDDFKVDPKFVIDVDSHGSPTGKGQKNRWWQLQRRFGVRPQQVTSPMLGTWEQAQRQAEGLLRFYSRLTKTAQLTIPGDPRVRLGTSLHLYGVLDGQRINRTYYVEGVQHDYQEGQSYTTTLVLTHGRDPGDPEWGQIAIPRYSAKDAAKHGGVAWYSPFASYFGSPGSGGGTQNVSDTTGTDTGPASGEVLGRTYPGSPVPGQRAMSGFGHGTSGLGGFSGQDYFAPSGSPCVAPIDGRVMKLSGSDPKLGATQGAGGPLGWSVYIQGGGKTYYLTHMGSRSVKVGQTVKQGQKIGTVANYHSFGRADHIHCGVYNGNYFSAVQSSAFQDGPEATTARANTPGGSGAPPRNARSWPLQRRGRVTAYANRPGTTHWGGGWQDHNAVDINVPIGTPILAVTNGYISEHLGYGGLGKGGHYAGKRLYLVTRNNVWYYAHCSRLVAQPGERVSVGQIIAYSGEAVGVAHLHLACKRGDPADHLGIG